MQLWQAARAVAVGVVLAGLAAGCASAPDLPFGVRATETVWCADADGVVDTATWQGHDGPLTGLDVKVVELDAGDVSEGDLLDACTGLLGWLTSATLCEAYAAPEALQRDTTTHAVSEVYGQPGPDPPGFPVVVRGRVSCADVPLDAGPAAALARSNDHPIADRLRDWPSTQRFNEWRAREAMWRDAADDGCLDIDAAREHGLTAQAELEGDWPMLETARDPEDPSHAGLCFDVRLRRQGFIEIGYHAVQRPSGSITPEDTSEPDTGAGRW